MDRRRFLLTSLAGAIAAPLAAEGQQTGKVFRIGFLHPANPESSPRLSSLSGLRSALADRGYVEGRDYVFEERYALGQLERLPGLATELIGAKVDVIIAAGQAIDAARRATSTIPIVMLFSGLDPVAAKRVDSLARPGGNVTGIALLGAELTEKRLELLERRAASSRKQ